MNTIILQTVARLLIPMQLTFSLFLLIRGHNDPGGGFIAALVVATAIALHAYAFTPQSTRRVMRFDPIIIAGTGLLIAVLSGTVGLALGEPFMAGQWLDFSVGGTEYHLGTPLLFDIGVYLLVIGMTSTVMLGLMEGR
jgi:multicomponent Na+:H+ antiporter subunit B